MLIFTFEYGFCKALLVRVADTSHFVRFHWGQKLECRKQKTKSVECWPYAFFPAFADHAQLLEHLWRYGKLLFVHLVLEICDHIVKGPYNKTIR